MADTKISGLTAQTTLATDDMVPLATAAGATKKITGSNLKSQVIASDAEIAALAGLTSAADKLPYFTGSGTAALADFTAAGRAIVDDADATAQRTTLGLAIGTNVQAFDADLSTIAAGTWTPRQVMTPHGLFAADANAPPGANVAEFIPFWVETPTTVNLVVINIGVASGNIDVGIYDNDGTAGAPATRLVSSGSTACPTAGQRAVSFTGQVLAPGLYYSAFSSDNGTVTIGYRSLLMFLGSGIPTRYEKTASFPLPASVASPTLITTGALYVIQPWGA